jgi:uncharacterized RDD family membrane protein YckC
VYCSKCGANLADDAAFCGSCGNSTGRHAVLPPAQTAPSGFSSTGARGPYADPAGLVVSRGFTYAGFWARFLAFLIDRVILGVAILVLFLPLLFLTGLAGNLALLSQSHGRPDPAFVGSLIAVIAEFVAIALLVQWLYYAYLESGEKQATWGKQALGIYVTNLTGNRISFGNASGRFFAKIISGMIPLGIGYIMAAFTERKQALHDMIASTLVLQK